MVLEVASRFVNNQNIDQTYFRRVGISRSEWWEKYGKKIERMDDEDGDTLSSLYTALAVEEGEDVYLGDGVWLTSNGSLHDWGR
jgi:hypothetical protein